jgi:hypothetical protein
MTCKQHVLQNRFVLLNLVFPRKESWLLKMVLPSVNHGLQKQWLTNTQGFPLAIFHAPIIRQRHGSVSGPARRNRLWSLLSLLSSGFGGFFPATKPTEREARVTFVQCLCSEFLELCLYSTYVSMSWRLHPSRKSNDGTVTMSSKKLEWAQRQAK